ncbi:hypothetical protein ERO13_D06G036500v2 [Gossypium hirsutum]|uniref:F-box associated domain-containing protein n=3 Tax=Gossypium TaxID=3633 RepID=A0A0D2U5X0_GOSRA|nr:hypothetical protein ES319_D06G040700v1 [Gossypium barbadense]KAG4140743.1 hypothetical protein ERO13_D06G036500v2 [Gossypium hirsutum]KJB64289.1 hypothetical protein B456_010G040800 [Gossypium raimondii]TYG63607.1 hypothetical protein ES288_D06G043400v1 [Gossypium darwinii]
MSGDTSDSSSYFDGREPDELIRALVQKRPGTDGKRTLGLHFIDLESNKVFIKAMPPDAPSSSTAVSCGNHVYVIGGIRKNDATPFGYDDVNDVFQLDLKDLERGWRKTTSMLFPRSFPHVLAAEGKIYVYDISGDIWEPLSPPPEAIDIRVVCVPVLDSSRSRILVHCDASDTLYAYYYDRKSWVCLEQKFCYWFDSAAIVDDVLYTFIYKCSLEAYNLLDKKHLPVKWSSEFPVAPPLGSALYRLGNGKLILGWVNHLHRGFECIRFNIWCNEQGGIHAAAEHQSAITVPYPEDISSIWFF